MTLRLDNCSEVHLDGILNDDETLTLRYDDQDLSQHGHSIEVASDRSVRVVIRVPATSFAVHHEDDDGVVQWRGNDRELEHSFPNGMTDPAGVEVAEQRPGGPRKTVHIKVTPKGGLPDR